MDKVEFDFTKLAGICLWSALLEVSTQNFCLIPKNGLVTFESQELHLFVSLFNSDEEVTFFQHFNLTR